MKSKTSTRKSVFPKSIHNMIASAYKRNEKASHAADRISKSATAKKLSFSLSTQQVAAAYAWITMRN